MKNKVCILIIILFFLISIIQIQNVKSFEKEDKIIKEIDNEVNEINKSDLERENYHVQKGYLFFYKDKDKKVKKIYHSNTGMKNSFYDKVIYYLNKKGEVILGFAYHYEDSYYENYVKNNKLEDNGQFKTEIWEKVYFNGGKVAKRNFKQDPQPKKGEKQHETYFKDTKNIIDSFKEYTKETESKTKTKFRPPKKGDKTFINNINVNVRDKGSSLKTSIVCQLNTMQEVEIISVGQKEKIDGVREYLWYEIKATYAKTGKEITRKGWVFGAYLEPVDETKSE